MFKISLAVQHLHLLAGFLLTYHKQPFTDVLQKIGVLEHLWWLPLTYFINRFSKFFPGCKKGLLDSTGYHYFLRSIAAWKVSIYGVFVVGIFPHSDWIRRDKESLSVFNPRICSKCGKIRTRKTPNMDAFRALYIISFLLKKEAQL